jgi:hypothetical protein
MRGKLGAATVRLMAAIAVTAAILPGVLAGTAAAGPDVTIEGNSASLDTFQALNATVTRSHSKSGNDFVAFGENVLPANLTGTEGTAKAFAQQASTMVTPSSPPFPTSPLNAIAVSGRARSEATKKANSGPGVPVADSSGSLSVDFTTSGPTPFQFDGFLLTTNEDPDNCTEITVDLSGPVNHSFTAHSGGGCSGTAPHQRGWVIIDVLPGGDYTLSVDYDAEVDPENPGTQSAFASLATNIEFNAIHRPDALISRTPNTGFIGDDVYNTTGAGQTRTTNVVRPATGQTRTVRFFVKIQDDGNTNDTYRLHGTGDAIGFAVRYFDGATNVSGAVKHGTFQVPLQKGASHLVRVVVTVTHAAHVGSSRTIEVLDRSAANAREQDLVAGRVAVT